LGIGYPLAQAALRTGGHMASHHEITEHKHGEMDISHHEKTFAGFIKFSVWTCVLAIGVLTFMALSNA
jgi:hypothetical protein